MKKTLAALFLYFSALSNLYACALCSMYDPTILVGMEIGIQKDAIKKLDIEWEFSELFTNQSILQYDENKNALLDETERSKLQKEFNAALYDLHYYTNISIDDKKVGVRFPDILANTVSIEDGKLTLRYVVELQAELPRNDHILQIRFRDPNGFYGLFFREDSVGVKSDTDWKLANDTNLYNTVATLHLTRSAIADKKNILDSKPPHEQESLLLRLAKLLSDTLLKLQNMLYQTQESGGIAAWLGLLGFSFFYGMLHALGPGHGKSIVGAYVLSNDKGHKEAWSMAGFIGIIHVLSAFLLTLIATFLVRTLADEVAVNSQNLIGAVSGILIVILALYLLYSKLIKKQTGCSCGSCGCDSHGQDSDFTRHSGKAPIAYANAKFDSAASPRADEPRLKFSAANNREHRHVDNHAKKSDLLVALGAGMTPCPGTVLVFMAVFSIGALGGGILSAIFMSLGMSFVIGSSASLGVALRGIFERRLSVFLRLAEIGALFVMLLLGSALILPFIYGL